MVDVQEMRTVAEKLRRLAQQLRHNASLTKTADLDSDLLDQAAAQLENSGAEIDRLRELISR